MWLKHGGKKVHSISWYTHPGLSGWPPYFLLANPGDRHSLSFLYLSASTLIFPSALTSHQVTLVALRCVYRISITGGGVPPENDVGAGA